MWHVVTMDNYVEGPFNKISSAKEHVELSEMDPRKNPIWKRDKLGQYEYKHHHDPDRIRKKGYMIVNDKRLPDWYSANAEYATKVLNGDTYPREEG